MNIHYFNDGYHEKCLANNVGCDMTNHYGDGYGMGYSFHIQPAWSDPAWLVHGSGYGGYKHGGYTERFYHGHSNAVFSR